MSKRVESSAVHKRFGLAMRAMRVWLGPALCTLPLYSIGCAPAELTEGIRYAATRNGVADASAVAVRGKAYLRFDANLRADLDDQIRSGNETAPSSAQAMKLLGEARELALQRTVDELDRMPPDGIAWLAHRYRIQGEGNAPEIMRNAIKQQYAEDAEKRIAKDFSLLQSSSDVRRFLLATHRNLEPLPGDRGRTSRALLAAPFYVPAVIGAEMADAAATERAMADEFENAMEYKPAGASLGESTADPSALTLPELAALYAPVLVQQVQPAANFDERTDQIGRVFLTGTDADIHVAIDTMHPVVYWAHSQARIADHRHDQLTYVMWYPGRPALTNGDVQAGDIDGVIVRITLDRQRRPAVYEFTQSCGCYHTIWMAEFVEAAARNEFGSAQEGNQYAVQRATKGKPLFLSGLVHDDGTRPGRPRVLVGSGQHLVVGVKASRFELERNRSVESIAYALEPYESLTHLPLGNSVASMFGSDGLVHNAGRKEGLLLAPTGMLSAGQPRQLGTMKIRMDAYDLDDPHLLENNLRFPSEF